MDTSGHTEQESDIPEQLVGWMLPYKENVAVSIPVATGNKNRTQNLEDLQKIQLHTQS